ncbi:Gpi-anchored protein [Madurella fahalii]|uniref:Gpi-anchored protein n=1 Tax=Madurella fahalii TaxID=1157608 RepID=A0ABQ0G0L7_9PEZI
MKTRRPLPLPALWALLFLALISAPSVCASLQPFQPVETAAVVAKRQACLENFYSCANQGPEFNGICCQNDQRCALDANNNPACCPNGAVCTGTAPASFVPPAPSTTAVSYVPNTYFSFPYIATYFANPGHCSAAVSQCNANHAACTSQLGGAGAGGGYAVTIVVPGGGGTTVTAGASLTFDAASATSICNSLSSEACRGLQPTMCTLSGTTAGGFVFGTETGNAAARPTAAPAAAAAACAGLVGAVAAAAAGFGIL